MASAINTPTRVHPRDRTMAGWRARKAVMASRGEVDGPRVEECTSALTWWRHRTYLVRDMGMSEVQADELLDLITDLITDNEAVTR